MPPSRPQRVETVIFDIDGTLVDSVDLHARAWQESFRHFGHEVRLEDVRWQIGKGGDQLMPVFLERDEVERRGEEIERYRGQLYKDRYMPLVRPFPGVRPLFEQIVRNGQRVALASSAKGDELDVYKRMLEVEDLLAAETSKDDAEKSKPHPDIFAAAIERAGADPRTAVIVGDSPYDAQAAAALGIPTIGLLCGGFPRDVLEEAGCVALYRDPADLHLNLDVSPIGAAGGSGVSPARR